MPAEYLLELTKARVYPLDRPYENGIVGVDGRTKPFVVERSWRGPAGHYYEQWSIRRGSEILYRSRPKTVFIRGMQSVSTHTDVASEPLPLDPGTYNLVFVVEGRFMGSTEIEVAAASTAAA